MISTGACVMLTWILLKVRMSGRPSELETICGEGAESMDVEPVKVPEVDETEFLKYGCKSTSWITKKEKS
eukprot:3163324-Amphidinium_carterae.1